MVGPRPQPGTNLARLQWKRPSRSSGDPTNPYLNAQAPSYVVSGNPGNAEQSSVWSANPQLWTAWRSYHFGYSHMTIHNASHLEIDVIATNLGDLVTDNVMMVKKDKTCNFGPGCFPTSLPEEPSEQAGGKKDARSVLAGERIQALWKQRAAGEGKVPHAQVEALTELFHTTGGLEWRRLDINGRTEETLAMLPNRGMESAAPWSPSEPCRIFGS